MDAGRSLESVLGEPFFPLDHPPTDPLWIHECRPWTPALVAHYLQAHSREGDLVVDPFAVQATLATVGTAKRRRMLLSNFSPATTLAVGISASPPEPNILDPAFSRIADAPRRGQTLALRVQSLYETICPECAQTAIARYFVWNRSTGEPVEKAYTCDSCQSSGLVPTDMADGDQAASLEMRGAAYWGLLSRLVAPGDPLTGQVRSLLDLYTPRALVAISELITALEQRLDQPDERRAGQGMVLHALERGSSLIRPPRAVSPGAPPLFRSTKTHLQPPGRFVEYNIWLAFEEAYRTLRSRQARGLPTVSSLRALQSTDGVGAVLLQSTNVSDLVEQVEPGSVALVLTDPPAFDPAMYALAFLWSGWLFGRETAQHLKAAITVSQWSWNWYARVLTTALNGVRQLLCPGGHLVLAFSDDSTRRSLALMAAAQQTGFRLVSQSMQAPLMVEDPRPGWRLAFVRSDLPPPQPVPTNWADLLRSEAQEGARQVVHMRGEPVPATLVHSACVIQWLVNNRLVSLQPHPEAGTRPVSYLVEQTRLALTPEFPPSGLKLYREEESDAAHADQWMPEQVPDAPPLADRVEEATVDLLGKGIIQRAQLESALYYQFPGWETPDASLIGACLASYAQERDDHWYLRPEDEGPKRARERGEILLRLHRLGHDLGFQVWVATREQSEALGLVPLPLASVDWSPASLVWHQNGEPAHAFAISSRAALHPWLLPVPRELADCPRYGVLPGGRAGLLDFKLRRNPGWRAQLAWTAWEFVKFRHVRLLATQKDLTRAGFRARIGLDPIVTLPGEQLALFEETV